MESAAQSFRPLAQLIDDLLEQPWQYGFLALMRRFNADPTMAPVGTALRPQGEAFRLGQKPGLIFAPSEIAEATIRDNKVHIYELRSDLQSEFSIINTLPSVPPENVLVSKDGGVDEYAAGQGSRSMAPFDVAIAGLGITLTFTARALANAINTSNSTTIQQALRRTSPRTFASLLKAAWRLHIDKLSLSSSWRPMLGSRLHKMGIGLDVVRFDDDAENIHMVVNNNHVFGNHHGHTHDDNPFPATSGGQELSRLYAELNGDAEVMHGAVYTPWMNWVEPHDTHMHITAKDE